MLSRARSVLPLILAGAFVGACLSTHADPETRAGVSLQPRAGCWLEPQDQPKADPLSGLEIRFRSPIGALWFEEVETELFSHRSDQLPPQLPTLRTTRRERFEELAHQDAEGGGLHHLQITLTVLRLEPAGGAVFDSREGGAPPADPLVLNHLSLLGIPLIYRLDYSGAMLTYEDVEAYRHAVDWRHTVLRGEAGLPPPTAEEEAQWISFLDAELTKPLEWGIRPTLPMTAVQLGSEWTDEVRSSTFFNASARWPIRNRIETIDAGLVTISRDADAEFEETSAIKDSHASLEGRTVLDIETGALVRSETTITGWSEVAPQPETDFSGGILMKLHSITRRERLVDAPPGALDMKADLADEQTVP